MQRQQEETTSSAASELYSRTIDRYKEHLSSNPSLYLKEFCRDSHVNYRGLLHWAGRNDISINKLRKSAQPWNVTRPSSEAFIQVVPPVTTLSMPLLTSVPSVAVLRDVSITFADGVNLSMKECSIANVMSLLEIYKERMVSKGGE